MINEDLASTLGATQMMQQMMVMTREGGAQRSMLGGGEASAQIGSKDHLLLPPSIVKDYEDLMKLKHGGTLRDKGGVGGAASLSPKQKIGMAMQRLEKLMRIKNQKLADKGYSGGGGNLDGGSSDNNQFGVRKASVESNKRQSQ